MIEKVEIGSRAALWIVLTCVIVFCCGVVPHRMSKTWEASVKNEQAERAELKALQKKLEEMSALAPARLKVTDFVKEDFTWDILGEKKVVLGFSLVNAADRKGPICLSGELFRQNDESTMNTAPGCFQVSPYSSTEIPLVFNQKNSEGIAAFCEGKCRIRVRDHGEKTYLDLTSFK